MRSFVDFYVVLGVHPSASQETIHSAYRQMAKRYHPDVASTTHPTQKMQTINEAYQVLGNPDRRLKYDRLRYAMLHSQEATVRSAYRAPGPTPQPHAGPFGAGMHDAPPRAAPRPSRQSETSGSVPHQESDTAQTGTARISRFVPKFARAFLPPRSWQPLLLLLIPILYLLLIATNRAEVFGACVLIVTIFSILDVLAFLSHPPRP